MGRLRPPGFSQVLVLTGLAGLIGAILLWGGRGGGETAQLLAAATALAIGGHAAIALGWRGALLLAACGLPVTFGMENLSQVSGFPFGRYRFLVGAHLPHVGAIPVVVGPLYLTVGYPAWLIASLLVAEGPLVRPRGGQTVSIPALAALVATQWDAVMDPSNSTLSGFWRWQDGGGYFGVPWTNFAGWFLTTWLYLQAFSLIASRRAEVLRPQPRSAWFWTAPVLLYLAAGLCHILPWLTEPDVQLRDASGRLWSASALRESAVVVMSLTMAPMSLLALARLWAGRRDRLAFS